MTLYVELGDREPGGVTEGQRPGHACPLEFSSSHIKEAADETAFSSVCEISFQQEEFESINNFCILLSALSF